MVNGFHLLHFDDPGVPAGSGFLQEALTVRLCLSYDLGRKQHTEKRGTLEDMSGNVAQMGGSSATVASCALGSQPLACSSHLGFTSQE